jgi:hypothetical protein
VRTRAVESYRLPFHAGYPTFTGQAIPGGTTATLAARRGGAPPCAHGKELCMHKNAARGAGHARLPWPRP